MLVTEEKPVKEVLGALGADKKVFIVGCAGCPEGWETGGPAKVAALADQLRAKEKDVVGTTMIDFLCNKALVGLRLSRCLDALKAADAVLVVSCGVGVQATAAMVDRPCHPALNTISSAGFQGLWPSSERCGQCGECVLSSTGGICPITTCAKSLLNGSCGGSHEGTCEVEKHRPCGWFLIYERLKALGKLDDYKKIQAIRDHKKMDIPLKSRSTIRWALEAKQF
ncbi:MAG: 5,10-methylene tetrahydromethanopterin reductase [Planctomycetes bacterium]|nr:5,10-methylene tetrahydromethanopterin reductase [Planctomycetota bacterium]